ncbi:hypothetical protein TU57_11060 [Bacillus cereus]|uniref:hypothetical protein n=1 Tax=Bacillus cereus group TaxID=86661 RepID=UPI00065BD108|nr:MULTISPECIES: hypothetical protein [Bacillus cereus group]KMP65252.1 hypothetical protein TU57_11060 [Bacillus cereus]MDX5884872.1 hypothetical protein [Bacillus cereus group sp. BfR-BA-00999]
MTKEYKADEFIYFIEEPTGEYEETGAKGGSTRKKPITKKILIDYDKIDSLDLEKRGEQVPFTHKHVVNTPLYMLYYWSPIIGDRACWLYQQLLTYCREDRDFLWDCLDELAYRTKMSRPTLNKHLDLLEENNFIMKIHRLNQKDNNRQTTPIIKVRQTIPLLSKEQYMSLSDSSKKQHDKFMEKYGKHSNMDETTYDSKETVDELIEGGEVKITQKMKKKIQNLMKEEKAVNYIATKLEFSDGLKVDEFHEILGSGKYISKPSYETLMKDSFVFYDREFDCVDIVVNSIAKQLFEDMRDAYQPMFGSVIREIYGITYGEYKLKFYSFEDYMYKLERGI